MRYTLIVKRKVQVSLLRFTNNNSRLTALRSPPRHSNDSLDTIVPPAEVQIQVILGEGFR